MQARSARSLFPARRRIWFLVWLCAGQVAGATRVSAPAVKQFSTALPSPPPPFGKLLPLSGRALSGVAFTVQCTGLSSAQCGANLDSALLGSAAMLELEDGTYTHSSTFTIGRDVTVRAKNLGKAVLDGENARTVMSINSGVVVNIEGLNITKGDVSACLLNFPCPFPHRPDGNIC